VYVEEDLKPKARYADDDASFSEVLADVDVRLIACRDKECPAYLGRLSRRCTSNHATLNTASQQLSFPSARRILLFPVSSSNITAIAIDQSAHP
jgi:hypothetical protein